MIVWGGLADEMGVTGRFNNGAAFNPDTNTWRMIADSPLSPRWYHLAVWTGEEMLVVGAGVTDGAAYDPETDTWREVANAPFPVGSPRVPYPAHVWMGGELLVWEPSAGLMASYDPVSDEWSDFEAPDIDGDFGRLFVGGGSVFAFTAPILDYPLPVPLRGARLEARGWTVLPEADMSTPEYNIGASPSLVVWFGDRLLAYTDSGEVGVAKTLVPGDDQWKDVGTLPINGCEFVAPPVAAGLSWYTPICGVDWILTATLEFAELDAPGLTDTRYAVWTGEEVFVWGNPCCFGTGDRPFEIEAWRFTP